MYTIEISVLFYQYTLNVIPLIKGEKYISVTLLNDNNKETFRI